MSLTLSKFSYPLRKIFSKESDQLFDERLKARSISDAARNRLDDRLSIIAGRLSGRDNVLSDGRKDLSRTTSHVQRLLLVGISNNRQALSDVRETIRRTRDHALHSGENLFRQRSVVQAILQERIERVHHIRIGSSTSTHYVFAVEVDELRAKRADGSADDGVICDHIDEGRG